jgi:hypothetical protein
MLTAGFVTVWPQFIAIGVIGAILSGLALLRFLRAIAEMT